MKKLSKEDLSLDKQEVSALGGSNGTKDATDICTITTVQTTLDSHNPPCCYVSDDNDTCGKTCQITYSENCTETDVETTCVVSETPDCLIPLPETKGCPE